MPNAFNKSTKLIITHFALGIQQQQKNAEEKTKNNANVKTVWINRVEIAYVQVLHMAENHKMYLIAG